MRWSNEQCENMTEHSWRRMVNEEYHVICQGKSLLQLADEADTLGINDSMIEMIQEPERTMMRRMRAREWPQAPEMTAVMPPAVRVIIQRMYTVWRETKLNRRQPTKDPETLAARNRIIAAEAVELFGDGHAMAVMPMIEMMEEA